MTHTSHTKLKTSDKQFMHGNCNGNQLWIHIIHNCSLNFSYSSTLRITHLHFTPTPTMEKKWASCLKLRSACTVWELLILITKWVLREDNTASLTCCLKLCIILSCTARSCVLSVVKMINSNFQEMFWNDVGILSWPINAHKIVDAM